MKTYVEKFIENIETDELDFEEVFRNNELLTSSKVQAQSAISISIEEVEKIINELKKNGANRVYIEYHEDHITYIFSGVQLKEV